MSAVKLNLKARMAHLTCEWLMQDMLNGLQKTNSKSQSKSQDSVPLVA